MWLLLPAAGLLSIICCVNGYLVYRRICDSTAAPQHPSSQRSLKRQSSDLILAVRHWTESSAGQLMAAGTAAAVCLYIALDPRMWARPELLLPFLVTTLCSLGGFLTYRYLAFAKMRQAETPIAQQSPPPFTQHGDSAADFVKVQWYSSWQKYSNRLTTVLVVSVGLASFQQAIKDFSAGTQLMICSTLGMPVCSLAGFMMYVSSLPQRDLTATQQLQQNNQKLAAGLGMLLAFTAGFLGLKSSSSVPVLPIACFGIPLCCLAGFFMYRFQLYLNQPSAPSSPRQEPQTAPMTNPVTHSDQPASAAVMTPDSGRRLWQNSDTCMADHVASNPSYHAFHTPQSVLVEEVVDVKPLLESLPIKQQVWEETERPTGRLYEDPQGIYVPLMPDGEEHYHWKDGSEYYGEWRDGQPSGRGMFVSQTGDRYEGEWQDGKEHGAGSAVAADGSSFFGTWLQGKRHGEGVHKPSSANNNRADIIFLRDYEYGVMTNETVLRMADKDAHRKAIKKDRSRKIPDKKIDQSMPKAGEHIFKGHRSYDLMRELQLGIMFSIANASKSRVSLAPTDITQEAFGLEVSQYLRSHNGTSFKWKDYSPLVFQRLRQLFGIDNMDYLLSLTGDRALRLLASPGKSGSAFFLSDDDRFLIKTVQQEEMRLLLELIPKYYRHVEENSGTLLTRFHGLHMVKPVGGAKSRARFVVMGNVFPTDVRLHRRYDLKGSTLGRTSARKAGDPNTVLKDLDIDFQLVMNAFTYDQLMEQLRRDCALLESLRVMDYSLLLGVHFLSWEADEWHPPQIKKVGSGISRAAANANNPLHWFSGGHTHRYPQCDKDESAPVTPSAGMTASSDAGVASVVSSIDDSALKGTPRRVPGHVTFGAEGGVQEHPYKRPLANRASLFLQQPLGDDSRQHSWTAGRPAPKYRPPGPPVSPPGVTPLHHLTQTHDGLQTLSENDEAQSQYQTSEVVSPKQEDYGQSAVQQQHMLQPLADAPKPLQNGDLPSYAMRHSQQPVFSPVPPLAEPHMQSQTDTYQQPVAYTNGWADQAQSATATAGPTAGVWLPLLGDGMVQQSFGAANSPQGRWQIQEAVPRAVSPFESIAERPFMPQQMPQPIATQSHPDSVHFADNPLFTPLDTPDGAPYRQHQQVETEQVRAERALLRTRSAPLRPRHSLKRQSVSPTKQELHAFESLLAGTGAQMPDRLQLMAAYSADSLGDKQAVPGQESQLDATRSMRCLYSKRCRDRPGVSIPALAVFQDGSKPEPVLIYFGIIDFLQEYRTKKRMEHVMKAAVFGGKTISVLDPHRYAKRFKHFMEDLFIRK